MHNEKFHFFRPFKIWQRVILFKITKIVSKKNLPCFIILAQFTTHKYLNILYYPVFCESSQMKTLDLGTQKLIYVKKTCKFTQLQKWFHKNYGSMRS